MKMSESQKGEKHWLFGKHHSPETRAKISVSLKGENSPNYGKTKSTETRAKMSASAMGKHAGESIKVFCTLPNRYTSIIRKSVGI